MVRYLVLIFLIMLVQSCIITPIEHRYSVCEAVQNSDRLLNAEIRVVGNKASNYMALFDQDCPASPLLLKFEDPEMRQAFYQSAMELDFNRIQNDGHVILGVLEKDANMLFFSVYSFEIDQ